MSRNTAALIIAVLVHLLLLMLLWIILFRLPPVPEPKPEEQRIKISLKERPEPQAKSAAVKNQIKPTMDIPPMPKGSQLEKVTQPRSTPLPTPQEHLKVKEPEPTEPNKTPPSPAQTKLPSSMEPRTEPMPPEKPFLTVKQPEERNASNVPADQQGLFAKLSKKQYTAPSAQKQSGTERQSLIGDDIREAYGDAFGKLSEGEQQYLLDNQEIMRRLTQEQLIRTGRTDIPNNLRVNDTNLIEFYLHPNGDMTDFRFVKQSGFALLDDVTKDTIESVYWKYPRPKQKTLIRYQFNYLLRGY